MKYIWKIHMSQKGNFLGVFWAMWRICIHATYKTGMERICHTCVTNAFEICDEFGQILHTRITHTREKYEVEY